MVDEGPSRGRFRPVEMNDTERHAITISQCVTESKKLGPSFLAVQQHGAGLVATASGALTRGHDRKVHKPHTRMGDTSVICGRVRHSRATDKPDTLRVMIIGFDADDTLWHNEDGFQATHREFQSLLTRWATPDDVEDRLFSVEMRNMGRYGYGVKAFTLSMVEAAIDISDGEIGTDGLSTILELGHHLLDRPVELIDGVDDVLDALDEHTMIIITKGDLYHQLAQIDSSGLSHRFWRTEVVAHKDAATYSGLLKTHGIAVEEFVMVGNSVPSDVLPVLEIGARAIHVPYHVTWAHEHHDDNHPAPTIHSLDELPALIAAWTQ